MGSQDHTEVTNAATALRDMYALHCAELLVPGDVQRRPALSVPEGPTTHGGLLARQHLTLESTAPGATSITVGWVDVAARRAALRTFPCLIAAHHARFGADAVGVEGIGYERFLHVTRTFLVDQGIAIEMEHRPPELPPVARRSSGHWRWAGIAVAIAVAILVAWLMTR
ncbi:MAG: hypothetical protein JW751_28930 [Polyangiaceae bacterium]|nr:hypothetical protein [Polyangiaceae bacterium]